MVSMKKSGFLEPVPLELLREPLVWFFAEHYRHRDVCKRLLLLLDTVDYDAEDLQAIHDFLDGDLPVHIIDEEDDLFPLLRRRCEPEDYIENVLGMLSGEHANDMHDAQAVKAVIVKAISEERGLRCYLESQSIIEHFCSSQKRHIAMENAVVLPIARIRITDADLQSLGQRLAARRGLPDPFAEAS
jgi:iron-sulfur cluster repair protein YtfE (RIC family)